MSSTRPLWRRGVEAVDKAAAPVLEGASKHPAFSIGFGLYQQTRSAIYRRTERTSRRFLHALNLPTASDVNRLLAQIASVENGVRVLNSHLQESLPARENPVARPTRGDR